MCEKSYTTKPVDLVNLTVEPPSPILRSKYYPRISKQVTPRSKPVDSNLKKPVLSKRSNHFNLSCSGHMNMKTKDSTTNPRVEVKTTLTPTTGRPRKMLSANFPSTVETLPLRNKMSLVKSSISRSSLYKSPDYPSTWSRQMSTSKPTTPRVYGDCYDSYDLMDQPKNSADYKTQNTNMGYREKCLQWLLTLPD